MLGLCHGILNGRHITQSRVLIHGIGLNDLSVFIIDQARVNVSKSCFPVLPKVGIDGSFIQLQMIIYWK